VIPAINGILGKLKRGARLEVVLTDWAAVHPYWVARGVDHYSVPTDSARNDCIRFGAPPDLVDVVGIPVRREFGHPIRATAGLGLDPHRFKILAMVGAEGSARAVDNLARLAGSDLEAQLVVICGRSADLQQRIQSLPSRMPLKALGFVEDVGGLMCTADLLVTKAGGLTLAEALCVGVPVVVYDAVPGQEVGNLRYMLRQQAVAYAARPSELVSVVSDLMRDQTRRESLARRGHQLARPHAAADIAANMIFRSGG
jgi:processive 1,2-diacylglycerol beta-glucosyltransferase